MAKTKPTRSKPKTGKKAIQKLLEKAVLGVLRRLQIDSPSKEAGKVIRSLTKKLAALAKKQIKKTGGAAPAKKKPAATSKAARGQ